jgi:hypothetical protein
VNQLLEGAEKHLTFMFALLKMAENLYWSFCTNVTDALKSRGRQRRGLSAANRRRSQRRPNFECAEKVFHGDRI